MSVAIFEERATCGASEELLPYGNNFPAAAIAAESVQTRAENVAQQPVGCPTSPIHQLSRAGLGVAAAVHCVPPVGELVVKGRFLCAYWVVVRDRESDDPVLPQPLRFISGMFSTLGRE